MFRSLFCRVLSAAMISVCSVFRGLDVTERPSFVVPEDVGRKDAWYLNIIENKIKCREYTECILGHICFLIINITIFLNVLYIHWHSKTLQPVGRMLKRWHWRHGRRAKATMFACLHMVKRDLERPSQCKDLRQDLRRFEDLCWQARKPLLITLTDSGEQFF